ncbi:MAG: EAL domain-containing protein, partial [Eubacteriales bacterium]
KAKINKKGFMKATSFMVALVLLFVLVSERDFAYAIKDDYNIKVKIAFPMIKSISEVDTIGNPKGYNFQYMQEIATHTDFEYEYRVERYEKCIEKLKSGELDVIGYVNKSPEKAEYLDFTSSPAGTLECMLVTDEYSSKFLYNDYRTLQNARVGMLRNNIYSSKLEQMQAENGLKLAIYEYDSESTLRLDLSLGKIDCALVSNYDNLAGYREIYDLGTMPFYFGVSKASPNHDKILAQMNRAMKLIVRSLPNFNEKIALGYKENKPMQVINLTDEEKEYIKYNKKIKVAYSLDWIPMSFYDFINRHYQGFIFEMLDEITENTGIEFEYIWYKSYSEAMKAVELGQVDLIGGCDREFVASDGKKIALTQPYVNMKTVAVYNPNSYNLPVAIPKPYFSTAQIKAMVIGKDVELYDTIEECLKRVNEGQASYTYLNKYAYEVFANTHKYPNLVKDSDFNQSRQLSIGVSCKKTALVPIFNKVIAPLGSEEVEYMLMASAMKAQDNSMVSGIKRHPMLIIILEISVALVIVLLSMLYRYYMKRRDRRLNYNEVSGVWNFTRFQKAVNMRLSKEKPDSYSNNLALVHIDIAKFKYINDIYGFNAGDSVLSLVGTYLKNSLNVGEFVGALWADHFVLFLAVDGREELEARINRIFGGIADEISKKLDYNINFRAGAYIINKNDIIAHMSVIELMKHSNYALGTIAENYRTNFICYDESMAGALENTRLIYKDMMIALRDGAFIPYYQAKYNVFTGKLVGVEVLVRWNHGIHGMIPPSVFVPHLETTGFIVELDFQMFEAACANLQNWINQNFDGIVISTNFSRRHLKDKRFVRKLTEISDRFNIPRGKLEIEITESMGEYGQNLVETRVNELRTVGYRVSIDDFGSGFSSISLLQSIHADVIKLDRQFLLATDLENNNHKVMEAIVALSQQLGMEVICEGVETQEQVEILKNVGCKYAQGYYYSKPLPLDEFVALMKRDA